MRFTLSIIIFVATLFATPFGTPLSRRSVDRALVPEFGHPAGLNPTGTGDCDGITNAAGKVIKIPCSCPPARATFLQSLDANVAAGKAVNNPSVSISFPTDDSTASQLARIQTALITLQNLNGPGKGCPAASTTLVAQQQAIQNSLAPPPATVTAFPRADSSSPVVSDAGVNPAFVPDFGITSGQNPTGTGDCDGTQDDAGQVVKIPCSCPPDRDTFLRALNENVLAREAVNNTSVAVSFPTDDSNASKAARITASLITLQNLEGPGKGCPAASTTFLAQLKAIQ